MKILLFGAKWCKDCKVMQPLWRNIKLANPDLKTEYYEFDDSEDYCRIFGIMEVPTAIFANEKGKELDRIIGIKHKDEVLDLIKKYKNL